MWFNINAPGGMEFGGVNPLINSTFAMPVGFTDLRRPVEEFYYPKITGFDADVIFR